MKEQKEEAMNSDILERGLLAHVLRRCCNDSESNAEIGRTIVGILATIVQRESFQDPDLARVWAAVCLWSADESSSCLAAELYEMFNFIGDETAKTALMDLSCAPFPSSTQEAVAAGLEIRDLADYRENARLEEDARGIWIDEECEREDIPGQPDDDVEW